MQKNTHLIYKFLLGLLFGFGLIISGMIYPSKVIGFLNIFGIWDPSLIFVMLGGIFVYSIFHFLHIQKIDTLLGYKKNLPAKNEIDKNLILGSTLFGIGWGIAGYCPGPALVSFGTFSMNGIIFIITMIIGMYLFNLYQKTFVK